MSDTLDRSFSAVDEIRLYIPAGGVAGEKTATNHSINDIVIDPVALRPASFGSSGCVETLYIGTIDSVFAAESLWQAPWHLGEISHVQEVATACPSGSNREQLLEILDGSHAGVKSEVASKNDRR